MFGWFKKKSSEQLQVPANALRPVLGGGVYRDGNGQVIYNMLDPAMQQFLGRCVGAIKKAGMKGKGTGSFSVLLGENEKAELQLDPFWKEFCNSQSIDVFTRVTAAAKQAIGGVD
jgi:hypothetical protein